MIRVTWRTLHTYTVQRCDAVARFCECKCADILRPKLRTASVFTLGPSYRLWQIIEVDLTCPDDLSTSIRYELSQLWTRDARLVADILARISRGCYEDAMRKTVSIELKLTRMSGVSDDSSVQLAMHLPDWSTDGLLQCIGLVLPVCPCVVSFSESHEPYTTDLMRTNRQRPRSILVWHVRFPRDMLATSSRGSHEDATRRLLPWNISHTAHFSHSARRSTAIHWHFVAAVVVVVAFTLNRKTRNCVAKSAWVRPATPSFQRNSRTQNANDCV